MNGRNKASVRGIVLALLMVLAFACAPKAAYAAGPKDPKSITTLKNGSTITMYIGDAKGYEPVGAGTAWDRKSVISQVSQTYTAKLGSITDATQSNFPKVMAYLYSDTYNNKDILVINGYQPGKSKVTFTYNGKKYKITVVVKKYVCPVKQLKIGKTSYLSKVKKDSRIRGALNKIGNKKISVKAASGWTLKGIYVAHVDYSKDTVSAWKKIKNGTVIPKKYNTIEIVLQNKTNKGVRNLYATL